LQPAGVAIAYPATPVRTPMIHPYNLTREPSNTFFNFYNDIRNYSDKFFEYYRMSIISFDELLKKLRTQITKKTTKFRRPVSPEERLTITIR